MWLGPEDTISGGLAAMCPQFDPTLLGTAEPPDVSQSNQGPFLPQAFGLGAKRFSSQAEPISSMKNMSSLGTESVSSALEMELQRDFIIFRGMMKLRGAEG